MKRVDYLEEIIENIPTGVMILDLSGKIVLMNHRQEQIYRIKRDQLIGRLFEKTFPQIKHRKFYLEKYQDMLNNRTPITFIFKDIKAEPSGLRLAGVAHGAPLPSGNGFVLIHDIYEEIQRDKHTIKKLGSQLSEYSESLKKVEASIEERLVFEKILSEMSAAFINLPAKNINKEMEQWLQRIVESMGADGGTVIQLQEDGITMKPTHWWMMKDVAPLKNHPIEDITSSDVPWISRKIRQGEVVTYTWSENLPDEAEIDKKFLKGTNIKSLLSVPVSAAGKVIGSCAISTVTGERKWDNELIQRLKLVGEIFANTLLRKKSEESLSKAFSEIKQLKNQIEAERDYLRDEIRLEYNYDNIVGDSQILKYTLFKVEQVAPTDATVMILGETGTGKELISRAIHGASLRKARPFIKVNCATLPENLIESELFGHEKGAFTGAEIRREGRFELAHRGTLFLDEIGEIPPKLQPKLLRVLQDGKFERLGSSRTITVDVRIIAATNRDLEKEVQGGQFREDLWYRLNVYPITVPPLRRRKEDIPLLVRYFVDRLSRKNGKKITSIPKPAMEYYKNYNWPGNIRELENVIERAIINTQNHVLYLSERQSVDCVEPASGKRRESLAKMERDYIIETLEDTNWKITGKNGAAAILDLNPSTLRGRMRKLGIQRPN